MLLAAPLPASAAQPPAQRPYAPPAALSVTRLGTPFAAWRAGAQGAAASCTPGAAGAWTCRLADVALGAGYRARDLTYAFSGGRLARIGFDTSADALPFATALVKAQLGAPAQTVRDHLATPDGAFSHVSYRWSSPHATARVSDPTAAIDRLSVVMSAPSTEAGAGAAAPA